MPLANSLSVLAAAGVPPWNWIEPLWMVAVGGAAAFAALFLFELLLGRIAPRIGAGLKSVSAPGAGFFNSGPKVAAIMRTTAKEARAQPIFYLLLAIGLALLILFPFVSYYTLGEDLEMLEIEGLTVIKLLAIVLALWTASVSIAEEIESKTALTLLSKPVGRRQLIFGKYLGILWAVAVLFIILSVVFLGTVSYKVHYESRETSQPTPTVEQCVAEVAKVAPMLALGFFEAMVLAAIAVAISTRLPLIPNLTICLSIYLLGHLAPRLVNSSVGQFEIVQFVGRLLAAVLPGLDHFSVETAVSRGQAISGAYIGVAALYCALYATVAMLVALLLFEDRDLA